MNEPNTLTELQKFFNIIITFISMFGIIYSVLLFRMYNLFPSRKEVKENSEKLHKETKEAMDKLINDIRAAERNHSNLHMEFEKQKIHLDHLKETIEKGFSNQQQELKHLNNNIRQFTQNSAQALKIAMELEDRVKELER